MEQLEGVPAQAGEGKVLPTESSRQRRPIPAITHFAVLAAFLLPLTLLPYMVTRRQILMLRRRVESVDGVRQQDVKKLLTIGGERDKHVQTALDKVRRDVEVLRLEAERRERTHITSDNIIRSDLQQLLSERHHARDQVATLRELGSSLADVAAFMHEVELKEGLGTKGKDQRGIDRLRSLALRIRGLNVPSENK